MTTSCLSLVVKQYQQKVGLRREVWSQSSSTAEYNCGAFRFGHINVKI